MSQARAHPPLELSHTAMSEEDALRFLEGHRIRLGGRTMDPKAQIVGEFVKSIRVPGYFPPLPELRQQLRTMVTLMDELTGRRVRRYRIPGPMLRALGRVGDAVKRVYPFDFPLTGEAMDFATMWPTAITSDEITRLGVRFRDARESYADAIRWMVEAGHLEPRLAGRLAPTRRG